MLMLYGSLLLETARSTALEDRNSSKALEDFCRWGIWRQPLFPVISLIVRGQPLVRVQDQRRVLSWPTFQKLHLGDLGVA